jgi:hypothetical protein
LHPNDGLKEQPKVIRVFTAMISVAGTALICILAATCGGPSHSVSGCTGGPYNVVGDWVLTAYGDSSSSVGVINGAGLAVFVQAGGLTSGNTLVMPSITGTCSFSGTATAYGTSGSGGGTTTQTVEGNVTSSTAINGSFGNGGTFSLTPNAAFAPTALNGAYSGTIQDLIGFNLWELVLTPTGTGSSMSLSGTFLGAGCSVNGTFTQEGNSVNLNVFDMSLTYSGTGCPLSGAVTGVGFESTMDYFGIGGQSEGPYLYAVPSSGAAAMEIYKSIIQ